MDGERLQKLSRELQQTVVNQDWFTYVTIYRLLAIELGDRRMAMGGRVESQGHLNFALESSQESWMQALGYWGNLRELGDFMRANGYTDVRLAIAAMNKPLAE